MLIHLLTHCRILIMCHRRCRMESFMGILVKKWGNSAAIRIPSGLMVAAALDIGQEVEVREEGGRLIIEPVLKRSEEHTSELQSLMRISYAVFCLKKKNTVTICNII